MDNMNIMKEFIPFVSVIIPFYNVGEYARLCMESLIGQSYEQCEFICVNDGSTDNTPAILEEYSDDKRVRILHKQNGGLSSARNYGLDNATGDFVTFIDGDDYVYPNYIRCLVEATEGDKDRVVISPLKIIKYTDRLNIKEGWADQINYYVLDKKSTLEKMLYDELSVSACGKLVPRKAYDDIRFPLGKVSEEVATIGNLIKKHETYTVVEQPIYGYVMRESSIGHKKELRYKEIQDRMDAMSLFENKIKELFDINNDRNLCMALQYRWGLRLVDMATMYEKVTDDKAAVEKQKREVKVWFQMNIKKLIRNKKAPLVQRLRMLIYAMTPSFYCRLYSFYQKMKYNV